jgi:glycine C-acetyltransferase
MDGDIAPLPAIRELCDRYDVILVVDDAHGEGVLGRAGRGIVDHFHLHGLVDVEVGTLSKAFGVMGGVIAGRRELIEYLRQKARPNLFSSALTVPDVAANMAALEILEESPELVERLWRNGNFLKEHLSKAGFDTANSQTPITPVMLGEATTAKEFSRRLFEKGVFATAIVYPTVPKGKARIRAMVSAAHTEEDLLFAVDKFSEVAKDMGVL